MMPNFVMILTRTGAAKIAAAVAGGAPVNLSAMGVGDGNGNPVPPPTGKEIALIRERYRTNLNSLAVNSNDPTMMLAEMIMPSDVGGFAIHEVGVYDDDGDLFAYANFPATWKSVPEDGSSRQMTIQAAMKVTNSTVVNIVVETNLMLATKNWVLATITRAFLMPGGTTGQVWRKKSNADGDADWEDLLDTINIVVGVVRESQVAANGQTVFDLVTCSTDGVAVYIEGMRHFDFEVLSQTRLKLAAAPATGTKVWFVQNEPNEPLKLRRMAAGKAYFMGQI